MKQCDVFPQRFLTVADVATPLVLTIADVRLESLWTLAGTYEQKPVVSFQDSPKVLRLNKTNFLALVALSGRDDSDDWGGLSVELFRDSTWKDDKLIGCVRIRKPTTAAEATPAPPRRVTSWLRRDGH